MLTVTLSATPKGSSISRFRIVAQGAASRSLALPWLDSMASWRPVLNAPPCIEFDVQYPRWHQDGAK
jgi:hypothetical protein